MIVQYPHYDAYLNIIDPLMPRLCSTRACTKEIANMTHQYTLVCNAALQMDAARAQHPASQLTLGGVLHVWPSWLLFTQQA